MLSLRVTRLTDKSVLPARWSIGASGLDLHCIESGIIQPGERHVIRTGLCFQIPEGYFGQVSFCLLSKYLNILTFYQNVF